MEEYLKMDEAISVFRNKIALCFGSMDNLFQSGPQEKIENEDLKRIVDYYEIPIETIKEITLGYLFDRDVDGNFMKELTVRVIEYFGNPNNSKLINSLLLQRQ